MSLWLGGDSTILIMGGYCYLAFA